MTILHFAYGSNLWFEQMNQRCPEHKKVGKGVLKNYKWIIAQRGIKRPAANIVWSEGNFVEGYIYELTKKDEKRLDVSEGRLYEKVFLNIDFNLDFKSCMVYVDKNNVEAVRGLEKVNTNKYECSVGCMCTYASRINMGILDSKLSEEYVERYIRKFIEK